MTADSPIHGSAMLKMNTGKILSGSPCLGSWLNYGLGSENENLPGFCVMLDPTGGPISGAKNWSSGYMPASYQGVILRSAGQPILDLQRPAGTNEAMQRRLLDTLREYNAEHQQHAGATDKPIAGLLTDLKRRGLLDETLVVWGGEFGRQPTAEYAMGTGRDHNAYGFTMWLAGGGVRGGTTVGATDELGAAAVESRLHVKNLHATMLALMGLDPDRLTYFYSGLDQKLVGVEGAEPIRQVMA